MNRSLAQTDVDALARAADTALVRARDLLSWWHSTTNPTMFDLERSAPPTVKIQGFFDTLTLEGKSASVMGVLQTSEFRPKPTMPVGTLGEWVGKRFLCDTCWKDPSGAPRGFRYKTVLVKEPGQSARVPADGEEITLADIGVRYESGVMQLDLLDYARAFPEAMRLFGLLDRFSAESAYMVFHNMFSSCPHPVPPGATLESCFGYCVAPLQIHPSIQGYGPGRFYSALKQYRFFRMSDGAVRIEVCFVVAPRTEKILQVFGIDPVYSTASLLDLVTFKRSSPLAHMAMDRFALRHHGRVHRNLLEGMRRIWEGSTWGAAGESKGASGKT